MVAFSYGIKSGGPGGPVSRWYVLRRTRYSRTSTVSQALSEPLPSIQVGSWGEVLPSVCQVQRLTTIR